MRKTQPLIDLLLASARENNVRLQAITEVIGDEMRTERPFPSHLVSDVYSVSKSFTATGIGMLIDRGLISLDDTVGDILSDEIRACGTNVDWSRVTLRHVLSQTVGIAHGSLDIDNQIIRRDYGTDDYLSVVLTQPNAHKPGEKFGYSDSNFYLALRMGSKVLGEPLQRFLRRALFNPLHFQGEAWSVCPQGYAAGGTGLFLRVEDMAKLGMLYRDGGVFEGKRILSEAWINEATKDHFHLDEQCTYCLGFWRTRRFSAYEANGMLSQIIFVSPRENRVVAWQCYDNEGRSNKMREILFDAAEKAENK